MAKNQQVETVPVAGYVWGRMRLTCPAGMRQQDYAGILIEDGLRLYKLNPRMKLKSFRTSITMMKVTKELRASCEATQPDRAENLAQWASHLLTLALDNREQRP